MKRLLAAALAAVCLVWIALGWERALMALLTPGDAVKPAPPAPDYAELATWTAHPAVDDAADRAPTGSSGALLGQLVPRAMGAAAGLAAVLQLANGLGIGVEPQPGLFFVGLLYQLGAAVVGFTRTVFLRPR